jgi:hypothetical protein
MLIRLAFVAALVAAASGVAAAQTADTSRGETVIPLPEPRSEPPVPPEVIIHSRGYAQVLIRDAKAEDLFENRTVSKDPTIRHIRSGLECVFYRRPLESVQVFQTSVPRGDDVGCHSQWEGFTVSIFVTRFPKPMTVDEAYKYYADEVVRAYPVRKPYTGQTVEFKRKDGSPVPIPYKTGRVIITTRGQDLFSRLSVAVVNGWTIEVRVTGPLGDALKGDLYGALVMVKALDDVSHPGGTEAPAKP